jgi:histidinol phosphatase-like enzyme
MAISQSMIYTCPMHPEVEKSGPVRCPKCGMVLELRARSRNNSAIKL